MSEQSPYASIAPGSRIWEAVEPQDGPRVKLDSPWLEKDSGGHWWICATDSMVAARIPVEGDTSSLREVLLPINGLKVISSDAESFIAASGVISDLTHQIGLEPDPVVFRLINDGKTLEGVPNFYNRRYHWPVPEGDIPLRLEKVWATMLSPELVALDQVGVSPEIMARAGKAVGWTNVELTFYGPVDPIRVRPMGHAGMDRYPEALVMPVKKRVSSSPESEGDR